MSTGTTCSKQWAALKKRFDQAIKQYDNIHSGEEYPADLDWLVITEMQFMKDHTQNRPVLSTIDSSRLSRFSVARETPSSSKSNCTETENPTFSSSRKYTERLQGEKEQFSRPLLPKKGSIWSSSWNDNEKLRPFQALLSEKVPKFDDFAKVKFAKRKGIISSAEDFGKKLDNFSACLMGQSNEKTMYYEILEGIMKRMDLDTRKKFYDEAKSYVLGLQR